MIILTGCGLQPNLAQKVKIDQRLPTIQKVRAISDIRSVALEWTPFYVQTVDGYYIYRSTNRREYQRIAEVTNKFSTHFLDKKLKPATKYYYYITTFNKQGFQSRPSPIIEVQTKPVPPAVPFIAAVDHLPRQIKVLWRPHPNQRVNKYLLYRSMPENEKWRHIATVKGRLQAEYIDKGLKDDHIYYYKIVAQTFDGINAKESKVVKASTKPLPIIVRGLQATKNLPKKIIVQWLPNPEKDIVVYKVYKSIFEIGPYISVAKTKGTKYIDLIDEDGIKRYYKVTAVDKDGLESFKQDVPVVGQTLPKPLPPVINQKLFDGKTIQFTWESPDKRAIKYEIVKVVKRGFLSSDEIKFTNVTKTYFTDSALLPGVTYIYTIYAIDKYGLKSKPSQEIKIEVPEKRE